MVIDITSNVLALKSFVLGIDKVALHFTVQSVTHQLEHDIAVAVYSRTLSLTCKPFENLFYVGHIEVATQTEVLGFPVVA